MNHSLFSEDKVAKSVCIDFDGVISEYKGFAGKGVFGSPIKGVKESLEELRREGWRLIVHTTRGELSLVEEYLAKEGIPFHYLNYNPDNEKFSMSEEKPGAIVYVDDRALTFRGDWKKTYQEILIFKPWWK